MTGIAIETLNARGLAWAGAMQQSLMEATVLLAIVGLVWLLLRRRIPSAMAHGLFLLVLVKAAVPLVLPSTPTVVLPLPAFGSGELGVGREERSDSLEGRGSVLVAAIDRAPAMPAHPAPAVLELPVEAPAPAAAPRLSVSAYLMLAWAAIVAVLLTRFIGIHIRMARRLRDARLIEPAELRVAPGQLAGLAGLRRPVPIVETPWVSAPAVWGLLRPRVLVPPGLVEVLPKEQLTWALLHELVHIRRGDTWVLLLQRLTQIVFFFHPAVWVANRAAGTFREFACDDASLALTGIARRDCGAGFLAIIERAGRMRSSPALTALGLFDSYTLIRNRLERILDDHRAVSPRLSRGSAVLLGLAVLAVLPNVRAQAPKAADEPGRRGSVQADEPKTRPLALTVVDRRTGRPLSDAKVEATVRGVVRTGTTDQAGRFTIDRPEAEPRSVSIKVSKDGFVPTEVSWNNRGGMPITPPATYTLRLEPGTTISGLVHDPEGRPILGATVYVLIPTPPSTRPGPEPRADIWDYPNKTDAQGRWHCDVMPAELADVWIRLEHPDYLSDTSYGNTPKPPMANLRHGTGVMIMKKGLPVAGVVHDAQGRPVSEATVSQGSNRWGTHYPETTTDRDGRFRFAHVAPGELVLTVQAKGHAPDLNAIRVVPELPPVEVRLGPPHSLRGRVVDADGKPVAGAMVVADTWRGHRSLSIDVRTDADGRFQVVDLPDEPVEFQFAKEGFMNLPNQRLTASDKEVIIALTQPLQISGSVIDAVSGQPIDRFTLYEGMGASRPLSAQDRRRPRQFRDGQYAVSFNWPYPQVRTLHLEAAGYLPAVSRGFRFNEKTQVYDFKLTRGTVPARAAISGVVRLPDGSPAAGVEVALATSTAGPYIRDGRVAEPKLHPTVISRADGTFQFPPQAEPAVVLAIDDRGIAEMTEAQLANLPAHAMTLQPWGRVEGTLRVGAKPGAGERVALSLKPISLEENTRNFYDYKAETDAQGRFVFERVVPRQASVSRAIAPTPTTFTLGPWVPVEVKSGETARVSVGGTGRPVVGRIVKPPGKEVPIDWTVGYFSFRLKPPPITEPQNMNPEQQKTWYKTWITTEEGKAYLAYQKDPRFYAFLIERDGSFRIDDVAPGTYELTIQPFDSQRRRALATARRTVVVTGPPGVRIDEPLDLGAIELTPTP